MKRVASTLLVLFFALLLCGAEMAPEVCFENMPPPQSASFSPICTTVPFALPLREARLTSPLDIDIILLVDNWIFTME